MVASWQLDLQIKFLQPTALGMRSDVYALKAGNFPRESQRIRETLSGILLRGPASQESADLLLFSSGVHAWCFQRRGVTVYGYISGFV